MRSKSRSAASCLLLSLAVSLLILAPRIDGGDFVDRFMWAEDGNTFASDAARLGVRSFWTPYAGYLHLYPRLFALLASWFELAYTPLIYLIGWFAAFLLMARIVIGRLESAGASRWIGAAVVALIGLQPHSGESLFTLTNAQWFLAIALAVYLLLDGDRSAGWKDVPLLVVLGLTGPFSVVMVPVIMLKAAWLRDFRRYRASYLTILACALIQSAFIIHSGRGTGTALDPDPWHWFTAFKTFFLFGEGPGVRAPALAFWGALALVLMAAIGRSAPQAKTQALRALLLVLAGMVFFAVGLWATKQQPEILNPLGPGARYFVVPYGLVLVAVGVIGAFRLPAAVVLLAVFATACAVQFRVIDRPPTQFAAYAAFAKAKGQLAIPINPRWPQYPGWHLPVDTGEPVVARHIAYEAGFDYVGLEEIHRRGPGEGGHRKSVGDDPQILLKGRVDCGSSRFVGVEASLWRDQATWVQLFWSNDRQFDERRSFLRFYPKGAIQAQFALPNQTGGIQFRLDPATGPGELKIERLDIYCLE